jgi:hypothetical protein
MKMFKIAISEEQLKALLGCLDVTLRQGGLNTLATVTDLYNVLMAAQKEGPMVENK